LPGSLDVQVDALKANPTAGFVYGQALLGNLECIPLEKPADPSVCPQGDIFWELLRHNFVHCFSAVFRKSCIHKVGLLDQTIPGIDDTDFWIRIAELYPVIAVEQPVGVWRTATP